MLPGVYQFTVRLRHEHYYTSVILDTMRYKLIVLPASQLHSHFKFGQEVYKFSVSGSESFGKISLTQKVQAELAAMRQKSVSDLSVLSTIGYTLITASKSSNPLSKFVVLDSMSGQLRIAENLTDSSARDGKSLFDQGSINLCLIDD